MVLIAALMESTPKEVDRLLTSMQDYGVGRYHAVLLSTTAFGQQSVSHLIRECKSLLCKGGFLLVDSLETSANLLLMPNCLLEAYSSVTGPCTRGKPVAFLT